MPTLKFTYNVTQCPTQMCTVYFWNDKKAKQMNTMINIACTKNPKNSHDDKESKQLLVNVNVKQSFI